MSDDEIIFGVRKIDWETLKESVLKIHNRISELEKKLEKTILFTTNHIGLQLLLNEHFPKEIAELREKLNSHIKEACEVSASYDKDINELKEEILKVDKKQGDNFGKLHQEIKGGVRD